jgi:uncharacterized protein YjbI with pentapeptide repeats
LREIFNGITFKGLMLIPTVRKGNISMQENTEKRISAIEEKLIEQEHRTPNVLYNFFIMRKKWSLEDPKRDAAARAIIWKLLLSPVSLTATSGILTIIILLYQNKIMADQNDLIREQNLYFQTQIEKQNEQTSIQKSQIEEQRLQWTGQRRAELLATLYGDDTASGKPINVRAKAEALEAFVQLERNGDKNKVVDLSSINLEGVNFDNADLSNLNLNHSNFSRTNLRGANFTNSHLVGANFESSSIGHSRFNSAEIPDANFTNVKNIGDTINWDHTNVYRTRGLSEKDLNWMKSHGAIEIGFAPAPPSYLDMH